MKRRMHITIALALVMLFGVGQALWRSQPAPKPTEILEWEPPTALGEPPWESMVLIDFTADWCPPCQRMLVTVFRDPEFKRFLEANDFRPVRIEDAPGTREQFEEAAARYDVGQFPTLLLLDENGSEVGRVEGLASTEHVTHRLRTELYRFSRRINWVDRDEWGQPGGKLPLLLLNRWRYLDPPVLKRRWLQDPAPDFVRWANQYLLPARIRPGRHLASVAEYKKYGVTEVPTVIVFGTDREEIARFEGAPEVDQAPAELARIAREQGYEIPDPPSPRGR